VFACAWTLDVLADAKIPTGKEFHPEPEGSAIMDDPDLRERTLMRFPRGSRIFIPRVGFSVLPERRELRNGLVITFQAENQKLAGSKVHAHVRCALSDRRCHGGHGYVP